MKSSSPAFQIYARDVLADVHVAAMTLEEFGCYMKLLLHYWNETTLPSDTAQLARFLRVSQKKLEALWPAVAPLFVIDGRKLTHPDLDEIRAKQREWSVKSAEGGRRSGESRRKGGSSLVEGDSNHPSTLQPASASASASASAKEAAAAEVVTEEEAIEYAELLAKKGRVDDPPSYAAALLKDAPSDANLRRKIKNALRSVHARNGRGEIVIRCDEDLEKLKMAQGAQVIVRGVEGVDALMESQRRAALERHARENSQP